MPISYSQVPLDRLSAQRKDPDWVAQQLHRDDSRFVCVHRLRNLFAFENEQAAPVVIERRDADALLQAGRRPLFLGATSDAPVFALDLTRHEESELAIPAQSQFVDLRTVGPALPATDASLLAYARGLVYWHANNQHCGVCGALSYAQNGGHSRRCSNPECARDTFPRTDPAVIMLVENLSDPDNPRCLLGHNSRYPTKLFSTLAGFVDPGETLEECVAREVFEEAGVRVDNVRYRGSQPWPFPASIMLGFRATAVTTDIETDADEIVEAHWFTPAEVDTFGERDDPDSERRLPPPDSIARVLIDEWLADMR